jgi:hypothetical protein
LYLGIFAILSPAFDFRFYDALKPAPCLASEISHAVAHFRSILHKFSQRFIVFLEGEPLVHSYVADRMLAEFAAATVVFAKKINEFYKRENGDEQGVTAELLQNRVEGVLQASHEKIFDYYSRCVSRGHKHFVWTGPKLQISRRSADLDSVITLTSKGEMLDLPSHSIYVLDLDPPPPTPPAEVQVKGSRARGNGLHISEGNSRKRKR